jgi:hypothetical protein
MVQVPTATSVTIAPDTVQKDGVVEAKLTARPEEAVAPTVNEPGSNDRFASAPKAIVWATNPFCVTAICWPSTVMCAVRAEPDVFAVKEKLTTPLAMVPMVSQLWSLLGANTPVSEVVEGTT